MPEPGHPFSLAAGGVLDLAPAEVVACAAEAGFPLCGVRLAAPRDEAAGVARALASHEVGLLDVEVVRLGPGAPTDEHRELAGTAAELGARFLLTVSDDPDEAATTERVAALAALLRGSATRVALEPMAFTGVATCAAATRIARAAGEGVTVLADPLHLHRAGDDLAAPADPDLTGLTGYAQLADVADPGTAPADLAHEARHERVPPGEGGLALAGFVRSLPGGVPLAVEVQSDRLRATTAPPDRAVLLRRAAERILDT